MSLLGFVVGSWGRGFGGVGVVGVDGVDGVVDCLGCGVRGRRQGHCERLGDGPVEREGIRGW